MSRVIDLLGKRLRFTDFDDEESLNRDVSEEPTEQSVEEPIKLFYINNQKEPTESAETFTSPDFVTTDK